MLSVFWKYSAAGLLFVSLLLGMALQIERRGRAKAEARIVQLSGELKRITDERNTQKKTTERNVERVKVIYRDAESRAERIEKAPTPGQCRTSPEIMGADL